MNSNREVFGGKGVFVKTKKILFQQRTPNTSYSRSLLKHSDQSVFGSHLTNACLKTSKKHSDLQGGQGVVLGNHFKDHLKQLVLVSQQRVSKEKFLPGKIAEVALTRGMNLF